MGKDQELEKAFREFAFQEGQIFTATVTSVNREQKTIEALGADEMEYFDVRLTSAINSDPKVIQYPANGSTVLLGKIDNDDNTLFVCAISEVESIEGYIGQTEFLIDKKGYKVDANGENLKMVFNDMIDEINKIIVLYGTSINVGAMEGIKQRLNTILK